MNWGKAIIITFILFAGFILSIVYTMMQQRIDLVKEDYYKEELNYQKQINRISNANKSTIKMKYSAQNQVFTIVLPEAVNKGEVKFFRPSDKHLDFKKAIPKGENFNFDTKNMAKGRWKVQVYWTDGQNEYFKEENIFIE